MNGDDALMNIDLRCGNGGRTILGGVQLRIAYGRTTAILGPGGAGKTTLLRLLAGQQVEIPDFWVEGTVPRPSAPVSFLPQKILGSQESLLERLAASRPAGLRDERHDPLRVLRSIWDVAPEAVTALVPVLDLPTGSLPKALARLAAFTASVASSKSVMILDEPDAGLEGEYLEWVTAKLESLRGVSTAVVATHHLRFARRISDDSILLVKGRVVESGPTSEVFENPVQERTRVFLRTGS